MAVGSADGKQATGADMADTRKGLSRQRHQCGLCGKADGHNKRTCPQMNGMWGHAWRQGLAAGKAVVEELPPSEPSEPPTRR
jgi:hypothetical protein